MDAAPRQPGRSGDSAELKETADLALKGSAKPSPSDAGNPPLEVLGETSGFD